MYLIKLTNKICILTKHVRHNKTAVVAHSHHESMENGKLPDK